MEKSPEKISTEENLLRRVSRTRPPVYIKDDGTASSLAFRLRNGEDGLSVDVESLTTYEDSIKDSERYRLFSLSVSDVEEVGLAAIHNPIEENPAHALIVGTFTASVPGKLAKRAIRVHYPDHTF